MGLSTSSRLKLQTKPNHFSSLRQPDTFRHLYGFKKSSMIIFSLGHQLTHSSVGELSFTKRVPNLYENVSRLIPRDVTIYGQQFTDWVPGSLASTPFSNLCVMLNNSIM